MPDAPPTALLTSLALVLAFSCGKDKADPGPLQEDTAQLDPCDTPEVPAEATRRMGWQEDGTFISSGGRLVLPAGANLVLEGMPLDVVLHPDGTLAYVTIASSDKRRLLVMDLDLLEVVQQVDRSEAHTGLELSADATVLVATGGDDGTLEVFPVGEDGSLGEPALVDIAAALGEDLTVAGLALSPSGDTAWIGAYFQNLVVEIDLVSLSVTRSAELSTDAWDVAYVPGREELYVSDLGSDGVAVVDLSSFSEVATVGVSTSPAGLAVSSDGRTVYAAVSNGDTVVAVDTASRSVTLEARVAETDLLDEDGLPLPNSNVTSVWLDEASNRLFAARGSDNAVSVLAADTLELLGAFPVAMYPSDLELSADGRLVTVEYKGGGVGAGGGAKGLQDGSLTVIDVDGLDLVATTAEVSALYASPRERFPFECDGAFPVPVLPGQQSPIEHVILVVKENKTVDCLFGDMGEEVPGLTVDPENLRYPAETTPNQRALMKDFAFSDNFTSNTLESDSGHLILTATHLTHYTEWMWMETARNGGAVTWPTSDPTTPTVGNFFTHLVDQGVELQVYGEIVGMFVEAADGTQIIEHSDSDYPGGAFVNYAVPDQEKAEYLAERIAEGELATFSYVSFPNDHGNGTSTGSPTPESMVADNDVAVGILVDALSHSALWESSVVIVLQDDPQGCDDHVNAARTPLWVIGPWARRGYISPATADYHSVFATIEAILGVPPVGRPDAAAAPLWDMFTATPNLAPWTHIPRELPPEVNPMGVPGQELSDKLDFSGPDRNPELSPILDAYLLFKLGRITRQEAEERLTTEFLGAEEEDWEDYVEEAEEETFAFDRDFERYRAWARDHGLQEPERGLPQRKELLEDPDAAQDDDDD